MFPNSKYQSVRLLFSAPKTVMVILLAGHLALLHGIAYGAGLHDGFIANEGQWEGDYAYKLQARDATVLVRPQSLQYVMLNGEDLEEVHHHRDDDHPLRAHSVRIVFEGSQSPQFIEPEGPASKTRYNYYLGQNQKRWRAGLRSHPGLRLHELYPGIDLQLQHRDHLKYNLLADRPEDLEQVVLRYEGADSLALDGKALMVYTSVGVIREMPPVAWQLGKGKSRDQVEVRYTLSGNRVRLELAPSGLFSFKKPLVVDPEVVFASYSGSQADNWGLTATYDDQGYGYSGGMVFDEGFPDTIGAFQMEFAGGVNPCEFCVDIARDGALLRYTPDGEELVYATYFGGRHNEQPHSMVVNSRNELVVFGTTRSADFPVTPSAYDQTHNGKDDIFLMSLDPNGRLLSSTYFGGREEDGMNGFYDNGVLNGHLLSANYGDVYRGEVKVNARDEVWVASTTFSGARDGFPVKNAIQNEIARPGDQDACLFSFNTDLSQLQFSTFLGGRYNDAAYSLDLDPFTGEVMMAGGTLSPNFPVNRNAFQSMPQDSGPSDSTFDGWVAVVDPAVPALKASSYVGTGSYDQLFFVKRGTQGDIYVTGQSLGDWNNSAGTYQNDGRGQFILQLSRDLRDTLRVMEFGNPNLSSIISLSPSAFMVDSCGRVFFSGWGGGSNRTSSFIGGNTRNLPVTPDAFQKQTDGADFYIAVFDNTLSNLLYGTYLGGAISEDHVDGGTSRFDPVRGYIYQSICAGCGGYSDFPVSEDAWSTKNLANNCNNMLVKFDVNIPNTAPTTPDTIIEIEAGSLLSFERVLTDGQKDSIGYRLMGDFATNDSALNTLRVTERSRQDGRVVLAFTWRPACDAILESGYALRLELVDDACPNADTALARILIRVLPPTNKAPRLPGDSLRREVTAGDTLFDTLRIGDPERDSVRFGQRNPAIDEGRLRPPFPAPRQGRVLADSAVALQWATTCEHIGQWPFTVVLEDNHPCPFPRDSSFTRLYQVRAPGPPLPYTFLCVDSMQNGRYQLRWSHPDTASLTGHIVLRSRNGGPYRQLDSLKAGVFTYWDDDGKPTEQSSVCYRLVPVGKCNTRGDTSYAQCAGGSVRPQNRSGYIIQTTVEEDARIRLSWQASSAPDFNGYELYRKRNLPDTEWGSLASLGNRTDTVFVDDRVMVDSLSYCYKIKTYSFCTLPLDRPNIGCSVCLKGRSQPFRHDLRWNPYEEWRTGVASYTVERRYGPDTRFRGHHQGGPAQLAYRDTSWDYDWGRYHYRIRARQLAGDIFTSSSLSNEITLNQPPRVYVPSAFTPNADGLNERLTLRTLFVKSFEMRIYNRWGELVYETNDKNASWDGAVDELASMDNVFIYLITFRGWDGTLETRSGNITLLR